MRSFLFFLSLIALIAGGIWAKNYFTSRSKTSIKPEELIEFAKKESFDELKNRCLENGFKLLTDNGANYYYNVLDREPENGKQDSIFCKDNMVETVITYSTSGGFDYIVKEVKDYASINKYLSKHKTSKIPVSEISSIYTTASEVYGFDNCIVIDQGYSESQKGYYFTFMSLKDFKEQLSLAAKEKEEQQIKDKQQADSLARSQQAPEVEQTPSIAYIGVNLAHTYQKISDRTFIELSKSTVKGTKLTIIKEVDEYVYCDFLDADSTLTTQWLSKNDIVYEKP